MFMYVQIQFPTVVLRRSEATTRLSLLGNSPFSNCLYLFIEAQSKFGKQIQIIQKDIKTQTFQSLPSHQIDIKLWKTQNSTCLVH